MLSQPGTDLEIVEVDSPELTVGQVMVRLSYSGVCRSQLMEVRGLRGDDPWLPHMLAHEGVGTVIRVGPGVTKVEEGDKVILGWIPGTGLEAAPATFSAVDGRIINAGRVTTFSEVTIVSENRVYRKPTEIDDKQSVLFGCALLTGAGIVLHQAQPGSGQSLLINGLGGVGLSALLAVDSNEVRVLAADPDSSKRELAVSLGAEIAFDARSSEFVELVKDLTGGGVDIAIDASGAVEGIQSAFDTLKRKGGRLFVASHPPEADEIRIQPHSLLQGRAIEGSWGGQSVPDFDIPKLSLEMRKRNQDLSFMVPTSYPLSHVNTALADLERGTAIRPLLNMDS